MAQPMYRDYSKWIFAMEPRMAWVHLTRSQFRLFASAVMGLLIFSGLLLVSRMAVIKNGYTVLELRQERDRLLSEQKRSERQLRELQSLATAEQMARAQMGMVDINPNQVVYLADQAKPGIAGKAWKALFGE
jgi:hypothetical protein